MRSGYRTCPVLVLNTACAHQAGAQESRSRPVMPIGATALAAIVLSSAPAFADISPTVSVGAGVRTSFDVTDPSDGKKVEDFNLDSIRLYVSGAITDQISFM